MLKLKILKLKNIGRFVEPQEISFEKLGNLIQVDAQNNLTGGSSGSGKSTIFNSLDWLLGLSDLSTTVLQSRLTKDGISVEAVFDWDGKEVLIHRAKKLSITVDGVETTGSSKLTEELLDTILGMPRDLFHKIIHRQQGENGFFLQQTPAQMNAFLTDCLNLSSIRSKIDLIDVKTKDLVTAKDKAKSDLQASQAALDAIKSAQASLGEEPYKDVLLEDNIEGWKRELESAQATLKALQGSNQLEKDALQATKPKPIVVPYDRTQIDALEVKIKDLESQIEAELDKERTRQLEVNSAISAIKLEINNKISALKLEHSSKIAESKTSMFNLSNIVSTGKSAKEKAIQLAAQIKSLRDGTCHTCLQPWQTDLTKIEEERLLQELSECKIDMDASVFASKEIEEFKTALVTLNDRINIDIATLTNKMNADVAVLGEQTKSQQSPELVVFKEKVLELSKLKTEEFLKEDAHKVEQNAKNQKLLEIFFSDQKSLQEKHQKLLDSVNEKVGKARSQYEQNAQTLASYLIALNRYQTSLDSLKAKEAELSTKSTQLSIKSTQLSEDAEIAEEAKRCLKSYLSCSFDDALDSISESATNILRSVPTMANATVRLVGQKESNSGSVKDQVNALLDNDGEIDIPIKSLSGGERSALDLAVDLAVTEFIEERTNQGCEILFLDEIFNGFDSLGIEHALEMLKTFGVNKKMLLIEHDGVAKEFIQDKITVVRNGETSSIK
jgi:DNA repair exonuclease SbcCD ATPase subunit